MKKILSSLRESCVLFGLVQKRLFRRPAFWVILLLLPLVALSLASFQGDDGIFTAAVYREDGSDFDSALNDLKETSRILRIDLFPTPEEARLAVREGRADAAWIFSGTLKEMATDYLDRTGKTHITVLRREGGVFQSLARERLFSVIFSPVGKEVFRRAVEKLQLDPPLSEEELASFYDFSVQEEELVQFIDLEGEKAEEESVLLSPLRGMLSIVILLGTSASAVLLSEEESAGLHQAFPPKSRALSRFFHLFLPALDLSLAAFFSLLLTGTVSAPFYECFLLLLYALSCTAFSLFFFALVRNAKILSFVSLFVLLLSLIASPIFLSLSFLRPLSLFLPPAQYLTSLRSPLLLPRFLLFTLICFAASVPLLLLRKKEE